MKDSDQGSKLMVMGVRDNLNIDCDGKQITSKKEIKVLGVTVDNELSWETHVENIISKCRRFIFPIRYLRQHFEAKEMSVILQAHVVSHLTYCAPVWSPFLS